MLSVWIIPFLPRASARWSYLPQTTDDTRGAEVRTQRTAKQKDGIPSPSPTRNTRLKRTLKAHNPFHLENVITDIFHSTFSLARCAEGAGRDASQYQARKLHGG